MRLQKKEDQKKEEQKKEDPVKIARQVKEQQEDLANKLKAVVKTPAPRKPVALVSQKSPSQEKARPVGDNGG